MLEKKTDQCDFCSIALDESTDISDTVQISVFTRQFQFSLILRLLRSFWMCPMKGTTARQNIAEKVKTVLERFKLDPNVVSLPMEQQP